MRKILMGFLLIAMIAVGTVAAQPTEDLNITGQMPSVIHCAWTKNPGHPLYPWFMDVAGNGHPMTGIYNDVNSPGHTGGTCTAENNIADLDTYANVPAYTVAISGPDGISMKKTATDGGEYITGTGAYTLASPIQISQSCNADWYNLGAGGPLPVVPTAPITPSTPEVVDMAYHFNWRFQQDISLEDTRHPGYYKTTVRATMTV